MTFSSAPGGASRIIPGTVAQPGQQVLAEISASAPRYALMASWRIEGDAGTLAALADPTQPMLQHVFLQPSDTPTWVPSDRAGTTGSVSVVSYRPGRVVLSTKCDTNAILRCADRYTSQWVARVDGKPAKVLRVDYLMQGVTLTAGEHTVELAFRPPSGTLWVQFSGMALCLLALFGVPLERRLSKVA
jgi:hypothetical protein